MLSAAHCFEEPKNCTRYRAGFEMHELGYGISVPPHHISNHPNYTKLCGTEIPDFDFSILHFEFNHEYLDLNKKLIPACLPDDSLGGDFLAGQDLTISGWGAPFHDSLRLHKATLPGANYSDCQTYNDEENCTYITTNMMCAGDRLNRKVADGIGDSGGSIQC